MFLSLVIVFFSSTPELAIATKPEVELNTLAHYGGSVTLIINVTHHDTGPKHYVDIVRLWINGTEENTWNFKKPKNDTFILTYNITRVGNDTRATVSARDTVHGWGKRTTIMISPPPQEALEIIKEAKPEEVRIGDLIQIGDNVTMRIRITNIGNESVYNVSITDYLLSPWVFIHQSGNITANLTDVLEPENEIIHEYTVRVEKSGEFVLPRTRAEYNDTTDTRKVEYSKDTKLIVYPVLLTEGWGYITLLYCIILAIPGIPMAFFWFSNRKKTVKRKKRRKK